MNDDFKLDLKDILTLTKWAYRAPERLRRVSAGVLTDQAIYARNTAIKHIFPGSFIIRAPFYEGRLRFDAAQKTAPVDMQTSYFYSRTDKPRFTGWTEQETGAATDRTKTLLPAIRGGTRKGRAKPAWRLKPGKDFPSPDDISEGDSHHRAFIMLQILKREGYRKPFIITGHRRMKSGLYKFGRGSKKRKKIIMLQNFEPRNTQPKRIKWMSLTRGRVLTKFNHIKAWKKFFNKELMKKK